MRMDNESLLESKLATAESRLKMTTEAANKLEAALRELVKQSIIMCDRLDCVCDEEAEAIEAAKKVLDPHGWGWECAR